MISQIIKSITQMRKPATIKPLGYSVTHYRVWPHQIDYNFHLNNAKYISILEKSRWVLFRENGWFTKLLKARTNLVIASMEITFIREIKLFKSFDVHSRILTWDEKYIYVEQRITVEGQLYAHFIVKTAGICRGKRAYSQDVCNAVGIDYHNAPQLEMINHWHEMTHAKRDIKI